MFDSGFHIGEVDGISFNYKVSNHLFQWSVATLPVEPRHLQSSRRYPAAHGRTTRPALRSITRQRDSDKFPYYGGGELFSSVISTGEILYRTDYMNVTAQRFCRAI